MAINKTTLVKDLENKKLFITRNFDAPIESVWSAWTQHELLDQWWAPRPWKTETKSQNFSEGGRWLYCMAGPEGEKHWCRADYKTINPLKSYTGIDAFCDENGISNSDVPSMQWNCNFIAMGNSTKVEVEITFSSVEDLETIIKMGFEEGFTAAHGNLDELLAK